MNQRDPNLRPAGSLLVVGKSVPRTDAIPKVTGAAQYVADLHMPGMLHAAVLRSPHPHARLLSIDITAAAALPGVKAVVTGADTARKKWGCFRPDLYPLAIDKVRYVGDEVAAVAARDPQTARAAIDLIKVEYEVLPAVLSLDAALAPGAPRVHDDAEGNVAHHFAFERGDVDAGFKASDVIVEGTWQSGRQWHTSLETIGCVAQWTGDRVSLWCNTQTPYLARGRYAIALGLPESKVRVVQTEVGGGFGGKSGDDNASVICALLAKKSGKPVKLIHTREEEFLASHPRMPMRYWVRLGFSRDGRIKAKEIKMLADNGAYTGKSQAILGAATVRHDALYKYPCARADSTLVYTNLVPTGAFRGFGNPSADWAVEQCWDLAAEKLGMDVVDLLRLNAVEPGDVSPHNHKITSCELKQCIDKSAHMIGWKKKRAKRTPDRGLGIGCSVHVNGRRSFGDWDGSSAIVRINDDGRATIITGEGEIGQGTLTVLRQIAAEELGLPYDDVDITRPDTDRSALCARRACEPRHLCRRQCGQARRRRRAEAAARRRVRAVQLAAGRADRAQWRNRSAARTRNRFQAGRRRRARAYLSAERPADHRHRQFRQSFRVSRSQPLRQRVGCVQLRGAGRRSRSRSRHRQSHGARDRLRGRLRHRDTSRRRRRPGHGRRNSGSRARGHRIFRLAQRRADRPESQGLSVAVGGDDAEDTVAFADSYEPSGPYGAKGLGEIGLDAVPAAIANAIADAVGVRITEMPITAEKIYRALHPELFTDEPASPALAPKGSVWTRLMAGRPSGARPPAADFVFAQSVDEIVAALAQGDSAIVSGGMSHASGASAQGLRRQSVLIAVARVPELNENVARRQRRIESECRRAAAGAVRRSAYSQRLAGASTSPSMRSASCAYGA